MGADSIWYYLSTVYYCNLLTSSDKGVEWGRSIMSILTIGGGANEVESYRQGEWHEFVPDFHPFHCRPCLSQGKWNTVD